MNDDELKALLNHDLITETAHLVREMKKVHHAAYGIPLQITDRSIEMEIWGHLYCEYIFYDIYRRIPWKPLGRLYRFVKYHCTVIDIGESSRDSNRFVWDLLSVGRKLIAMLLKRKLRKDR